MKVYKEWSGYNWLCEMPWGAWHDDPYKRANCWYDPDCVFVSPDGILDLLIHENAISENGQVIAKYGSGLITSVQKFGYGMFTLEAKLPEGAGLWPAFWLHNFSNPGKEIDIFEGYSKMNNYGCWFLQPYDIQNCMHLPEGLPRVPVRKPWLWHWSKNPVERYVKYEMLWLPNLIQFCIDGRLFREITDFRVLDCLAGEQMTVIINTHINPEYVDQFTGCTPFAIRNFKHEKA